jgi:hypothetical protein
MKKFIITEEEKNRILDLHKSRTKGNYLVEQQSSGTASPYKKGGTYKYVFIDENGNEVTTPKVTLPTGSYDSSNKEIIQEFPSKGFITANDVYGNYSGGPNIYAVFNDDENTGNWDLQSKEGRPNIYWHPDFTSSKVLLKLIPAQ